MGSLTIEFRVSIHLRCISRLFRLPAPSARGQVKSIRPRSRDRLVMLRSGIRCPRTGRRRAGLDSSAEGGVTLIRSLATVDSCSAFAPRAWGMPLGALCDRGAGRCAAVRPEAVDLTGAFTGGGHGILRCQPIHAGFPADAPIARSDPGARRDAIHQASPLYANVTMRSRITCWPASRHDAPIWLNMSSA
jgi:hypothetical protein